MIFRIVCAEVNWPEQEELFMSQSVWRKGRLVTWTENGVEFSRECFSKAMLDHVLSLADKAKAIPKVEVMNQRRQTAVPTGKLQKPPCRKKHIAR